MEITIGHQMTSSAAPRSRLFAALISGAIAILLNTFALKAADLIPLATARGGLLRLMTSWLMAASHAVGLGSLWTEFAPLPASAAFQTGFHLVVGIAMALLYGFVLERILNGPAWLKGLQYAVLMWLINAMVILPSTGEGFAGSAHLSLAGMLWFAAAHTLFFVAVACLFSRFRACENNKTAILDVV
jgi:hypothetical protein